MTKNKAFRFLVFLIPLPFFLIQCFNGNGQKDDPRGAQYAGSLSCASCHKDIYSSYLHTAHFMASQPAVDSLIQGSFAQGANEFHFNPHAKVMMQKTDSGFYQTSYVNGKREQSERFDVIFGGVKGQTYAYWLANELFQLPISYVSDRNMWVNSPGYDSTRAVFERAVNTRCLDCHMSFAKQEAPDLPNFYSGIEGFKKASLVYSVDCERCHGPAAQHVKFHTENPDEKKAKFIVAFNSLTREQRINMCAVCHSGSRNTIVKPTFGFKPGDTLSNYLVENKIADKIDYKYLDVHGNQKALLESSKCFMKTSMDCSTCHDTHINDRDKLMLYADKCMSCHQPEKHTQCKMAGKLSTTLLANNCISCHMPAFSSHTIVAGQQGALVHTHHIDVYPEEAQKVLAYLKIKIAGFN
ncbi:MAG TPA: multiheme c-type cytochrome [Mucilaginibacter sp.]|nr:multiheme c-type cytochrome [Mucilaginibacter sp.]